MKAMIFIIGLMMSLSLHKNENAATHYNQDKCCWYDKQGKLVCFSCDVVCLDEKKSKTFMLETKIDSRGKMVQFSGFSINTKAKSMTISYDAEFIYSPKVKGILPRGKYQIEKDKTKVPIR